MSNAPVWLLIHSQYFSLHHDLMDAKLSHSTAALCVCLFEHVMGWWISDVMESGGVYDGMWVRR